MQPPIGHAAALVEALFGSAPAGERRFSRGGEYVLGFEAEFFLLRQLAAQDRQDGRRQRDDVGLFVLGSVAWKFPGTAIEIDLRPLHPGDFVAALSAQHQDANEVAMDMRVDAAITVSGVPDRDQLWHGQGALPRGDRTRGLIRSVGTCEIFSWSYAQLKSIFRTVSVLLACAS
jgi:hypothetical protein